MMGYGLLHRLLGMDRVSRTLAIAGGSATIPQFNTVNRLPDITGAAHRQNPNTTVLWFAHNHHDNVYSTSPEEIIQQAPASHTQRPRRQT